jgi:Lactoylglutathione lyase and related lyases
VELSAPDYVVLVVADLDASLRFWTGLLGLPLGHRSALYAQLDTGTTRLALYQRDAMAATLGRPLEPPAPDAPAFEVGFKVRDVDAAYAELVSGGARPVRPPVDQPWGQRTAYVADPDGHLVELVRADPRT